jgi:predicted O-methyltransferase YrrM
MAVTMARENGTTTSPTAREAIGQLLTDRPAFHVDGLRDWSALPGTLELLASLVFPGAHTVETGSGASTVVFAAAGARHLAISPDGREHERIQAYCRDIGLDTTALSFAVGSSVEVLPTMELDTPIDVAFIDGKHAFPYPVLDFHFIERRLAIGGCIVLDDVPIPAVRMVYDFLHTSPAWMFEAIADDRAAAFRKLAEPDVDDDDWVFQPLNRRYPDYSFAPLSRRARLEAEKLGSRSRRRLREAFPELTRAAKTRT